MLGAIAMALAILTAACGRIGSQSPEPMPPAEVASAAEIAARPAVPDAPDAGLPDAPAPAEQKAGAPPSPTGSGQIVGLLNGNAGGDPNDPKAGGRIRFLTTTVTGALEPAVILRIVRQNYGRYQACWEDAARRGVSADGRVTVKLTIGKSGKVSSASDSGSTLADKKAIGCILQAMRGFEFPSPEDGKNVEAIVPIDLTFTDPLGRR